MSGLCVTNRRVLDWMIGFIDTLYIPLVTTGNWSAIADLYILHFTAASANSGTRTILILSAPELISWEAGISKLNKVKRSSLSFL
jgi:hypothetical protein